MSSKDILIKKLNSSNYSLWKVEMQMLLMKEDLFKIYWGRNPNEMNADWKKKWYKGEGHNKFVIEDNQIVHVRNKTAAYET